MVRVRHEAGAAGGGGGPGGGGARKGEGVAEGGGGSYHSRTYGSHVPAARVSVTSRGREGGCECGYERGAQLKGCTGSQMKGPPREVRAAAHLPSREAPADEPPPPACGCLGVALCMCMCVSARTREGCQKTPARCMSPMSCTVRRVYAHVFGTHTHTHIHTPTPARSTCAAAAGRAGGRAGGCWARRTAWGRWRGGGGCSQQPPGLRVRSSACSCSHTSADAYLILYGHGMVWAWHLQTEGRYTSLSGGLGRTRAQR
jgi:hypothetical protein